jgi:hypothetical protein
MTDSQLDVCPICLEEPQDYTILDTCDHFYCLVCIREWSAVRRACPVCNTPFNDFTPLSAFEIVPREKAAPEKAKSRKKKTQNQSKAEAQRKPSTKRKRTEETASKKKRKTEFIDLTKES